MYGAAHGLLVAVLVSIGSCKHVNADLSSKFAAQRILKCPITEHDGESRWKDFRQHSHSLWLCFHSTDQYENGHCFLRLKTSELKDIKMMVKCLETATCIKHWKKM
ncbi:PREDICTED: uncharacterized protein LOC108748559 [Trachymyrmex septentrionalis]|uniref:uncharacterized protein LOC108748559 n=1 Tax=Trachymyrmex septentrionalis TaxID=34720 RepID=UPI00084F3AA9|nr:PREDICTED: uncharacterized protein LOC108748559 [Trachymyrmex septentrionalis]